MNRRIARQAPPEWQGWPRSYRMDEWRRDFQIKFDAWETNVRRYLTQQVGELVDQTNTQVQGRGADIVAAAMVAVTSPIHRVSGSATITEIIPPDAMRGVEADHVTVRSVSAFTGPVFLIPVIGSTWALGIGGNIYKAVVCTPGQALMVVFDGESWVPTS